MTTIRNPGHVLAPKVGDSMEDNVAQASALFQKDAVHNQTISEGAAATDAATLEAAAEAAKAAKAVTSDK